MCKRQDNPAFMQLCVYGKAQSGIWAALSMRQDTIQAFGLQPFVYGKAVQHLGAVIVQYEKRAPELHTA